MHKLMYRAAEHRYIYELKMDVLTACVASQPYMVLELYLYHYATVSKP